MPCDSWSQSAPHFFNSNFKLSLSVLILLWGHCTVLQWTVADVSEATCLYLQHRSEEIQGQGTLHRTERDKDETEVQNYTETPSLKWGTRWSSCLRHWATSRNVAGSIPDWHWLSLLTEMSTRNISLEEGGKGGRCVGLKTLTIFMCRLLWNPGLLNVLEPSGPVQACTRIVLPLPLTFSEITS